MSRIHGEVVRRVRGFVEENPPVKVDRLVFDGPELRDGLVVLGFRCFSKSKRGERVHHILLDLETLEAGCGCEWHTRRRSTADGLASYGPVDLFYPVSLCHHLERVGHWVWRHADSIHAAIPLARAINREDAAEIYRLLPADYESVARKTA